MIVILAFLGVNGYKLRNILSKKGICQNNVKNKTLNKTVSLRVSISLIQNLYPNHKIGF